MACMELKLGIFREGKVGSGCRDIIFTWSWLKSELDNTNAFCGFPITMPPWGIGLWTTAVNLIFLFGTAHRRPSLRFYSLRILCFLLLLILRFPLSSEDDGIHLKRKIGGNMNGLDQRLCSGKSNGINLEI